MPHIGLPQEVLMETLNIIDITDQEDFMNFQKRKETIMTNMDHISKMKFPENPEIQR